MDTQTHSRIAPLPEVDRQTALSLADQIAARAPHFVSFDHITDARVRRAKEIEQHLLFTIDFCPELKKALSEIITRTHAQAATKKRSVQDRIYLAMKEDSDLAPSTLQEFVEDLDLPRTTVYENLMKMAEAGLVIVTERKVAEHDGRRGGRRKPELIFTLASKERL